MRKGCVEITHNSKDIKRTFDKRLVNNFLVVTCEWRKPEASRSNFTECKDATSLYPGQGSDF